MPSPGSVLLNVLPPELREVIYQYTFGDNTPSDDVPIQHIQTWYPDAALLATCRQIRSEAQYNFQQAKKLWFANKWIVVGGTDAERW